MPPLPGKTKKLTNAQGVNSNTIFQKFEAIFWNPVRVIMSGLFC